MASIKKFEDLEIWQLAREQAKQLHQMTRSNHFAQDFPLRDQLNRSSGSAMDNIAEGFGRGGNREFLHFLCIARGSNSEVRSQILRAIDRNYIDHKRCTDYLQLNQKLGVKITNLISHLKRTGHKGPKFN